MSCNESEWNFYDMITKMIYKGILFLHYLYNFQNVECYVKCPYCDPNHMAYPNLEEAMRGYDVPMGNPNPGHGNTGITVH